jgi:GntR family transcriptional regulator
MHPTPIPAPCPPILRIAEHLTIEIGTGRLSSGDRLPTERSLAARYGVSMMTLRKALSVVTERGLIERRHGSGNYVLGGKQNVGTYALFRLEAVPDGGGLPTAELISFDQLPKPLTSPISAAPDATRIRRLRSLDDTPVAVEEIWLDPRYGPLRPEHLSESLYKTYADRLGSASLHAEDRVSAPPCRPGPPKHCVVHRAPRWDLSNGAASINTAPRRRPRAAGSPRTARATPLGCPERPKREDDIICATASSDAA